MAICMFFVKFNLNREENADCFKERKLKFNSIFPFVPVVKILTAAIINIVMSTSNNNVSCRNPYMYKIFTKCHINTG